jgi:hypothetical protein
MLGGILGIISEMITRFSNVFQVHPSAVQRLPERDWPQTHH